jgi:hypothetical protein
MRTRDRQVKEVSRLVEYDLQYLGLIGNTFHTAVIERAIVWSDKYKITNTYTQKAMGIDLTSVLLLLAS